MADTSKESKKETPEEMSFRNEAIKTINSLVTENARLKDSMGKSKSRSTKQRQSYTTSGSYGLAKLQTLKKSS